ncbi:MAG: hypothetical protein ACFBSE_01835 [Prochloraceae cyanobacterium]
MWTSCIEHLESQRIEKITIDTSSGKLTYSEAIALWQESSAFRSFFSSLLARSAFAAYFWETPPITDNSVNRAFEFVLVDSRQLDNIKPDPIAFKEHFQSDREIVVFNNRRKDALLVAPCPIAKISVYPHLGKFIREAPESQKQALWQTLGQHIQQRLNSHPLWVNTSGLGVYWLHIRLDSSPKYYKFKSYK